MKNNNIKLIIIVQSSKRLWMEDKMEWITYETKKTSVNTLICLNHFSESDFKIVGRRKTLKKYAIPTIFEDAHISSADGCHSENNGCTIGVDNGFNVESFVVESCQKCSPMEIKFKKNPRWSPEKIKRHFDSRGCEQNVTTTHFVNGSTNSYPKRWHFKAQPNKQIATRTRFVFRKNGQRTKKSPLIQFALNAKGSKVCVIYMHILRTNL